MRPRLLLASLAPLVLAAQGCGGGGHEAAKAASSAAATKRSEILITIDALAPRHLKSAGGPIAMPKLDALAASGVTYDDAVSCATLCRPALVTLMTGRTPDRSSVRDNIHDTLPTGMPTLAEAARAHGFDTAAFVSTPFASYSSGLQRGFDLFDGPEALMAGPAQHVPPAGPADDVASHFKEWLSGRPPGKPYFAWVHLADLNGMSVPLDLQKVPLGDKPLSDVAGYDLKLGAIDRAIGTIVDAVVAAGGSPVAWTVVGTHGAYLGEGGRFGDAFWLTDETLRIPLIRVEGAKPPATHDARPTWLPDVAATLGAALGASGLAQDDGVPLDRAPSGDRARYAWNYALDDQLAWPPEVAVREGVKGFEVGGKAASARPAQPRERKLSPEARNAVAGVGLRLGGGTPAARLARPDGWLRDLQLARRCFAGDRPKLAADHTKALVRAAPDQLATLVTRSFFFTAEPRKDGPALRDRLLALYPERSDALHWAAHIELVDKRYPQAEALLEAALAVGPVEPEMHYDLACVRSIRGDLQGALAELDRALAAGYRNWDWIDKDPDLVAVRADRHFPELLRNHGR